MATPHVTMSPTPGPSGESPYALIADALYEHCRDHFAPDEILLQEMLLKPDIIPDKDLGTLLLVCQNLVNNHLFKIHDVRGGGIGWKLNTKERAGNYQNLSTDESVVYGIIDSSGSKGLWTKTIKQRLNIHAKVVERAFKALESKGLIEPMKDVKYPSRKMFIRKGLKPSDEATGGSWYTDSELDTELIEMVGFVVEKLVGDKSWVEVEEAVLDPPSPGQKRKEPQDGFEEKGKGKQKLAKIAIGDDTVNSKPKPLVKSYEPYPPGYEGYPTLATITNDVNKSGVLSRGLLPPKAIEQLLQVMQYDDKLIKLTTTADIDAPSKIMYRTVKNPLQILAAQKLDKRLHSENEGVRKKAMREKEIEDLGSSAPCTICPVFNFCEDGGPVTAETCKYFDDWFKKIEEMQTKDGELM